jgi:hypothetical protein
LSEDKARKIRARIRPTCQKVRMADGKSSLEVVGETDITLFRNQKPFQLSAIVCRHTDTDILAGMPFLKQNDIAIRPFSDEIIINNKEHITYNPKKRIDGSVRKVTIHSNKYQVLLPGQSQKYKVEGISGDVAVEPRWDTYTNKKSSESSVWSKPQILPVVNGHISLSNSS